MPINETDRILKAMLREFKEIRSELHELNRNVEFHAVMTSHVSNQGKVKMLETMNKEKPGYPEGE